MKKSELRQIIKEIITEAKAKKYYVAKRNFIGDIGRGKRGEIFSHEGKSKEDKESVFMYLANPHQEFYSDIHKDDFDNIFRPIDPIKDTKEMTLLNKWGLVEFGNQYYVISVTLDNSKSTIKASVVSALSHPNSAYGYIKMSSSSPKQAIKKAGHNTGTLLEVGKDIWVGKMYADWVIVVTKKDPKDLGVTKLTNLIKKANIIKE